MNLKIDLKAIGSLKRCFQFPTSCEFIDNLNSYISGIK